MRYLVYIAVVAAVAAILAAAHVYAAGEPPAVRAYADKTQVTAGERFTLVIEINGQAAGYPVIPEVDGLQINAHPNTQSTKMEFSSFSGGNRNFTKQVYGYYAYATKAGKFTIPPIPVTVGGKTVKTEPIQIDAAEAAVPRVPQGGPARRLDTPVPMPPQPPAREGEISLDEAIFIESQVDKRNVYQGEPIRLTFSIWVLDAPGFRVYSGRRGQLAPPECEGFYMTPIEEKAEDTHRDGRAYKRFRYSRTLYPTVPGELRINQWEWQATAYYGLRDWNITRRAPAIPVTVKPLPQPPKNFSGAVGQFSLNAQLSRDEAVQGVPMQLVVAIRGTGNPDAIGAPRVPNVEKAYISEPDRLPAPEESGAAVDKRFAFTVTPLEPGELHIPPVEYCYFDPEAKKYETESTRPLAVRVLRSTEYAGGPRKLVKQDREQPEAGNVDLLGDDLFPLAAAPSGLRPVRPSSTALPVAVAAPVVAYAALALVMQRRRRFERDPAYARAHRAKARALDKLQKAHKTAEPAEELYKALIGYVADRYNLQEKGLTSQEISQVLEKNRVQPEVKEHVRKILRACERTRYGGVKLNEDEVQALGRGAVEAIETLEARYGEARS